MHKKVLLLTLLISCLLHVCCDDNEFAEFDDSNQDEISIIQGDQPAIDKKQSSIPSQSSDTSYNKLKQESSSDATPEKSPRLQKIDPEDDPLSKQQKKPDLKLVNVPSIRQFKIESFYIEILFILVTILYLINFFLGKAKNTKFAYEWYERTKDLLKQQFVLVGGAPTLNEVPGSQKRDEEVEAYLASLKKQRGLIKASESLFTLWNSGRVGMEGLLIELNLLKRQDLFSMALSLIRASRDNIIFRFALGQDTYENFVFCIAHRTQANKLVKDMVDINTFCPKRKPLSQTGHSIDRLVVMSELADVSSFVLDQDTLTFLSKYERCLNYIHITDHYSTDRSEETSAMQKLANPKRIATFSFAFPRNSSETAEYLMFALNLMDRLRKFKLARDSKQKSEKNRQKITEHLQKVAFNLRHEAAQAKKEELRRLEKERIYNEDDPEKQRRWEKKEAKREQKRNKMRVKQLRVKSM